MDDNSRINLTKQVDNTNSQGWRDPSTGEVYPSQAAPQQAAPQPQSVQYQQPQSVQYQQPSQPVYQQPQQSQPVYQQPQQYQPAPQQYQQPQVFQGATKFCKHCGQTIPNEAVICTHCGCQVEEMRSNAAANQPIIINNNNNNNNNNFVGVPMGRQKNKWVAVLLCLFAGGIGAHRFYEGKIGTGILYLFTAGLFGVGALIDLIILLCKPNPYYV